MEATLDGEIPMKIFVDENDFPFKVSLLNTKNLPAGFNLQTYIDKMNLNINIVDEYCYVETLTLINGDLYENHNSYRVSDMTLLQTAKDKLICKGSDSIYIMADFIQSVIHTR